MSDNVRTLAPRPAPTPAPAAPGKPSDLLQLAWRMHAAGLPLYPLGGIK